MPLAVKPEDAEALVDWLRNVWMAGSGDDSAAGRAAAEEYARLHAGELIGMSWNEDSGKWEQAERQEYRIGNDTRERISATVSEGIRNGDGIGTIRESLDPYLSQVGGRSLAVARTESALVFNAGTLGAGKVDGVTLWEVVDGPGCLPEGHDDEATEPDDAPGTVQLDRLANGQTWTTEQCEQYVLGHPNCGRYFVPIAYEDEAVNASPDSNDGFAAQSSESGAEWGEQNVTTNVEEVAKAFPDFRDVGDGIDKYIMNQGNVNVELRAGKEIDKIRSARERQIARVMDAVTNASTVESPVTALRAIEGADALPGLKEVLNGALSPSDLRGLSFVDRGFASTAIDTFEGAAMKQFATDKNSVVFQLVVPKGTRAAFLGSSSFDRIDNIYNELVLARGSKFTVTGAEWREFPWGRRLVVSARVTQ